MGTKEEKAARREAQNQQNITENYWAGYAKVDALLSRLGEKLVEHSNNPKRHWGHVGDLCHAEEKLKDVLAFFENCDPDDLDIDALVEARR